MPAERRRHAPMLKLALFASHQLDAINAVTTLVYDGLTAAGYLIAVETELKLGYAASVSV